jgi:hypothetical protein
MVKVQLKVKNRQAFIELTVSCQLQIRRKPTFFCEISGSHCGEYRVESLLGYDAVQSR